MTYRAAWVLDDATTPASAPDLGQVQPGQTKSVIRRLKNLGDQAFSAVQFTWTDALPGMGVTVGGVALTEGVMLATAALAPGATIRVVFSRTVPTDAEPGVFAAFIRIRALA